MIISITEAAKRAGVSRTTVYEKINSGELSRTSKGIDIAELIRVFGELKSGKPEKASDPVSVQPADAQWLREQLDREQKRTDQLQTKLEQTESELEEKEQAYAELKAQYMALPSPEEHQAKLERVEQEYSKRIEQQKETHASMLARQQTEQAKAIAEQREESEQWKASPAERQKEIEAARLEAEEIKQKAAADIAKIERRAAGERVVREALESRGLIARILNRKSVAG